MLPILWSHHATLPIASPIVSLKLIREYKYPMQKTPPSQIYGSQIEKGIKIAYAENTPFTNAHIIAKSYLLVLKTGPYSEECKFWDQHLAAEKIWLNFRIHFDKV